jgi:hypothetical protein
MEKSLISSPHLFRSGRIKIWSFLRVVVLTMAVMQTNRHQWRQSFTGSLGPVMVVESFLLCPSTLHRALPATTRTTTTTTVLFGKKDKRKQQNNRQQPPQEKQSVQNQRFDAATRQFMFTLVGLTKILPDKSKKILDNISLSFYPGAKVLE